MEKIIATIILSVSVKILMAPPSLAQKPGGETAANEGVCDVLQGATPGLHGLCVAFCEAQDHADVLVATTAQEIQALADAAPSGRKLANYNKKKKEGDPAMPCIPVPPVPPPVPPPVTDTCPCWPGAELAEIDGIMWDGSASSSDVEGETDGRRCVDYTSEGYANVFALEAQRESDMSTTAQSVDAPSLGVQLCAFQRFSNGPEGSSTAITLTVGQGTLTAEESAACTASLRDFQANSGFCGQIQP